MAGSDPHLSLRSASGRLTLLATTLGASLAILDGTVITVALPRIGSDLATGLTGLQWTVNSYTLALSALLLFGGSLGDRLGRRRIFLIGVGWFTVASMACAAAPSIELLVAMRALQGVGAALLTPASLAILQATFRQEDRSTAIGSWAGLTGIAAAIGPVLGGSLVGLAPWGWRLIFLINVPLAVAVMWTARYIPETRNPQASGRLDIVGTVLGVGGLTGLTLSLTDGPANGWTPWLGGLLAVGVLLLAAFLWSQHVVKQPLMPLRLFRSQQFSGTNAVTFALYGALSGAFFLLPVFLQEVSGLSPIAAGSALLPTPIVMLVLSPLMGKVSDRIGPRIPMTVGPIICALALVLCMSLDRNSSAFDAIWRITVFALGLSITVTPLTATALSSAPQHLTGVASAVNNAVARTAGLLVVAVLPGMAGMTAAVFSDPSGLTIAFGRAMLITGGMCSLAGVLAWITIRRPAVEV